MGGFMQVSAGKQRAMWLRIGAMATVFALVAMIYNVRQADEAGAQQVGPIADFCYDLLEPVIGDAPATSVCGFVGGFSIDGLVDPIITAAGDVIDGAVCGAFGALDGVIATVLSTLGLNVNIDIADLCDQLGLGQGIVDLLVGIDIDQILVSLLTFDLGGIVDGIGICDAISGIDISVNDLISGFLDEALDGVDTLLVGFLTGILGDLLANIDLGGLGTTISGIITTIMGFIGSGLSGLVGTLVDFVVGLVDVDGIIDSFIGLIYDGLVGLGVCDGDTPTPTPDSPTIRVTKTLQVNGTTVQAPDSRLAGWEFEATPIEAAGCLSDDTVTGTTNNSGVVLLEDLDPTCNYDVEELNVPTGYTVVPADGVVENQDVQPNRITNVGFTNRINGTVTDIVVDKTVVLGGEKVDAPSSALSGFAFTLESDPDNDPLCPVVEGKTQLTTSSGTTIFKGVVSVASDDETTCSYTVTESDRDGYTITPAGGVITLDPLDDTSQVRVKFTNTSDVRETGDIDITKIIKDPKADLEDWEFVIKGTGDGDCPTSTVKVKTDEDGEATVENLVAVTADGDECDYTITETAVDGWEIVSPASGTVTITDLDPDGESVKFENKATGSTTTSSSSTSTSSTSSTTQPSVERPTPVKPSRVEGYDRETVVPSVPAQQPGVLSFTG
jgi:hypothetical protein